MKALLLAVSLGLLSGCMSTADHYSMDKVDQNHLTHNEFTVDEVTEFARKKLRYELFDPTSLMLDYQNKFDAICNVTNGANTGLTDKFYGHNAYTVYWYKYNAKNRMGGYVGWKDAKYVIHNNRIAYLGNNYCFPISQLK